jgi:hypothetical protein
MRKISKFWTVGATASVAVAALAVFLASQTRSPAANGLTANVGMSIAAPEVATFAERFGAVWSLTSEGH